MEILKSLQITELLIFTYHFISINHIYTYIHMCVCVDKTANSLTTKFSCGKKLIN